jgi:hypothetical protein
LLTAIDNFSVLQAFNLCTVLSAISCMAAGVRLVFLSSWRQYRFFLGLLASWVAFCVFTVAVPVSSKAYLRFYLIAAPLSWVFYIFVARDLYQKIFDQYKGISFAGRACFNVASALLAVAVFANVWSSPVESKAGSYFVVVTLIDRSLLFALSFFLVLLVFVIARYPISIRRNLVVHTLVVSSILFFQSFCGLADLWSKYLYSAQWNTLAAALDCIFLGAWALLINSAGETISVRIRQLEPQAALHLLNQLQSLNGVLLRAARK